MGDTRITATRFTDAWARAYDNRARSYGLRMPAQEQKRMMRALDRMYVSMRRENDQRVAVGKNRIWFGTPKDV